MKPSSAIQSLEIQNDLCCLILAIDNFSEGSCLMPHYTYFSKEMIRAAAEQNEEALIKYKGFIYFTSLINNWLFVA